MNLNPDKYVIMTQEKYNELLSRITDLEKTVENIINSK